MLCLSMHHVMGYLTEGDRQRERQEIDGERERWRQTREREREREAETEREAQRTLGDHSGTGGRAKRKSKATL